VLGNKNKLATDTDSVFLLLLSHAHNDDKSSHLLIPKNKWLAKSLILLTNQVSNKLTSSNNPLLKSQSELTGS